MRRSVPLKLLEVVQVGLHRQLTSRQFNFSTVLLPNTILYLNLPDNLPDWASPWNWLRLDQSCK